MPIKDGEQLNNTISHRWPFTMIFMILDFGDDIVIYAWDCMSTKEKNMYPGNPKKPGTKLLYKTDSIVVIAISWPPGGIDVFYRLHCVEAIRACSKN